MEQWLCSFRCIDFDERREEYGPFERFTDAGEGESVLLSVGGGPAVTATAIRTVATARVTCHTQLCECNTSHCSHCSTHAMSNEIQVLRCIATITTVRVCVSGTAAIIAVILQVDLALPPQQPCVSVCVW